MRAPNTEHERAGSKTLLLSIVLSAPGPLVLGFGLLMGRSSTQIADFIRRTAELLAIVTSYLIYRHLTSGESLPEPSARARLEQLANLTVGIVMCLSGTVMLILSLMGDRGAKGNVQLGLIIALLGFLTNSWFWYRYTKLTRLTADPILRVQSRLYRAKSLVDACVTTVLAIVWLEPTSDLASLADRIGSAVVALYLVWSGVSVLRQTSRTQAPEV